MTMGINRIVSFLPSATELIYEFGIQEKLYGVTHECKYPIDASNKPRVIRSIVNSENMTSKEIDTMTCQLLKEGKDIFVLDEKNLISANPELIITQKTCEVCAAHTNQVDKALKILDKKPKTYSMDPHNLDEVIASVTELGVILDVKQRSQEIVNSLEKRVQSIRSVKNSSRPGVLAIEWIDPFFTAGHWVPEMVEFAGGKNMISKSGEHSRKLIFEEILAINPELIILMPCGFDVNRTVLEYEKTLKKNKEWLQLDAVKNNQVFAVDANSYFSKPSIRTIKGLEILAKIIQPEKFSEIKIPEGCFSRL